MGTQRDAALSRCVAIARLRAHRRLAQQRGARRSNWCRRGSIVSRSRPWNTQNEAPGVGLEPTTSRLTAERVCQLSYPGSGDPGQTGSLGAIVRRPICLRERDEPGLDLGVTIRAEKYALAHLGSQ